MRTVAWEDVRPAFGSEACRQGMEALWNANPAAAAHLAMHLQHVARAVTDHCCADAVADCVLHHAASQPEAAYSLASTLALFAAEYREPAWVVALTDAVRDLPYEFIRQRIGPLVAVARGFRSPEALAGFTALLLEHPGARAHLEALAAVACLDPGLAAAAAAELTSPHTDLWRIHLVLRRTGAPHVAMALLHAIEDPTISGLRSLGPAVLPYLTDRLMYLALRRPDPAVIQAFATALADPRFVRMLAARPHEGVAVAEIWCARALSGEDPEGVLAHAQEALANGDLLAGLARREAAWFGAGAPTQEGGQTD